jgi:hypothetical protein
MGELSAYSMNIRSILGINFQHAINEIAKSSRVRRLWVLVLSTKDSHGNRASLFRRLGIFEGRVGVG